jgi:hypothetical protein
MSIESKALPIPDNLETFNQAGVTELARIWWGGDAAQMNIRSALRDPRHMGAVLAEAAWNFANAYASTAGLDRDQAFDAICEGWTTAHARAAELAAQAKK